MSMGRGNKTPSPVTARVEGGLDGGRLTSERALVQLAFDCGQHLLAAGAMIVTAESCTGGMIARALTERAGSSAWFDRGFVTYSNAAKQAQLGVSASVLDAHGAVSEAVAAQMACGALAALGPAVPALALAVTGIAGPGGAAPGKPVGTVCFGWAGRAARGAAPWCTTDTQHWPGDRDAVRMAAAQHALTEGLRWWDCPPELVP